MVKVLKVEDLDCAHCAAKIEDAIKKLDGVNSATVSFLAQKITVDVDDDPRAAYFKQARFGMFARMSLLMDLARQPRLDSGPVEIGHGPVCHNPNCITQTEHYLPPLVKQNGGVDCCAFCDAQLR